MGERHSRQNRFSGTPRVPYRRRQGGVQTVLPEHTISAGGCWCGLDFGHDWPGKQDGAPHPRSSVTEQEEAMARTQSDTLARSELTKYPREVGTLLMHLVNDVGIRHRHIDNQHIVLYPPDGVTRPFKVSASRPGEQQNHYIRQQFMAIHDIPDVDGKVPVRGNSEPEEETVAETTLTTAPAGATEALRALAETLGVSIGGGVDENDYLALMTQNEGLEHKIRTLEHNGAEQAALIAGLEESLAEMTEHRDQLLERMSEARDALAKVTP